MRLKKVIFFSISMLLCLGWWNCSSDSWMNKQWHNTRARYNLFFTGEQKWLETISQLQEGHKDDFRAYIDLYNYGTTDNLKAKQVEMDEVIKSISTMIDKHPRSRWTDDGYLLLGKAYFTKGDFNAALEFFENIANKYKENLTSKYRAQIWQVITLIYQKKYAEAEQMANVIKNEKNIPKKLQFELNKMLAACYLKTGRDKLAAEYLEKALSKAHGKAERVRLHFALGQVYQKLKTYDLAGKHFAKVVKMNPAYEMAFAASLNRVELLSAEQHDYAKANKVLKRMLKDDKNIDYYGQIYYRMAKNLLRSNKEKEALNIFSQSISLSGNDKSNVTNVYLELADYFYKKGNFEKAGLYYDSANKTLENSHPEFENISKRGTVLSDLLRQILTIKKQDSLLKLSNDKSLLERTIDKLIELEKKQAEEEKKNASKPKNNSTPSRSSTLGNLTIGNSSFPFYNEQLRNNGKAAFDKTWGKRPNIDGWRIKKQSSNNNTKPGSGAISVGDDTSIIVADERAKYYVEIPKTEAEKKAALEKIEEAYFLAAGIYQNQLADNKSAITYYESLLTRFPSGKYAPQALYELCKLHRKEDNKTLFNKYYDKLKADFPNSNYLKLLDAKEGDTPQISESENVAKEITIIYEKMYSEYKAGKYADAKETKIIADKKFAGSNYQSKFDYLFALCEIKLGQLEKGKILLEAISTDYAGTEIAERAKENLDAINNIGNPKQIDSSKKQTTWKKWDGTEEIYFIISYPKGTNSNLLKAALNDFAKTNFSDNVVEVSKVTNIGETNYFTISGFKTNQACMDYLNALRVKPDLFTSKGIFEYELAFISKSNLGLLVNNMRIGNYFDFIKTSEK